jgi:hypothetical protein
MARFDRFCKQKQKLPLQNCVTTRAGPTWPALPDFPSSRSPKTILKRDRINPDAFRAASVKARGVTFRDTSASEEDGKHRTSHHSKSKPPVESERTVIVRLSTGEKLTWSIGRLIRTRALACSPIQECCAKDLSCAWQQRNNTGCLYSVRCRYGKTLQNHIFGPGDGPRWEPEFDPFKPRPAGGLRTWICSRLQ